jgi:aryl-alcohol dehydrogenase-like predicted oxidoreductase
MQYRTLGTTELKVSAIGLGCNNFGRRIDRAATRAVVDRALDLGINHLDTANSYGHDGASETLLGEILGTRRRDIVLATKFGYYVGGAKGGSRAAVMQAAEASLRRLRTDYIDLYYLHLPDGSVPIEETLRALDDLVKQGKVRYIGNSNFNAAELAEADDVSARCGLSRFVCAQDELSLIHRGLEQARVPTIVARKLALVPYLPLAAGLLTGKFRRGAPMPPGARLSGPDFRTPQFVTPANLELTYAIADFCSWRGLDMLHVAFAWLLAKPYVASVIAGAVTPEQIERNAASVDFRLSPADLAELDRLTQKTLLSMRS